MFLRSLNGTSLVPLVLVLVSDARADGPHAPPSPRESGPPPNVIQYNPPIYLLAGPNGYFPYAPPLLVVAPGGVPPFLGPTVMPAPPMESMPTGPLLAPPPRGMLAPPADPPPRLAAPRIDPARARQLVTFGERLFRARNFKRAEERFGQARRLDPDSAAPRIGLAQVALVRGLYAEAADWLRAAIDAEPGWLVRPADIQAWYAEPADFARALARLESHLQANPDDRDAWFALGAQQYLSGHSGKAADIFVRLTDQPPDTALAAFLSVSHAPARAAR